MIDIRIKDRTIKALVDSGAACSLISKKFVHDAPIIKNDLLVLRSASNHIMANDGIAKMTFTIANKQIQYPMLVVDVENQDCILGDDFLQDFNLAIDRETNNLVSKLHTHSTNP